MRLGFQADEHLVRPIMRSELLAKDEPGRVTVRCNYAPFRRRPHEMNDYEGARPAKWL